MQYPMKNSSALLHPTKSFDSVGSPGSQKNRRLLSVDFMWTPEIPIDKSVAPEKRSFSEVIMQESIELRAIMIFMSLDILSQFLHLMSIAGIGDLPRHYDLNCP